MMKNISNFIMLCAGYGIGQGSLFIAQTLLVVGHNLPRVAEFGISFYSISLALLIVDFGTSQFLTREIAHDEPKTGDGRLKAMEHLGRVVPVRIMISSILLVATTILAVKSRSTFFSNYMLFSSPALLFVTLNLTGVLDGFKMSGASGLANAAPFVTSSAALLATANLTETTSGAVLGASLVGGYAISLVIQVIALNSTGIKLALRWPQFSDAYDASLQGAGAMLTTLPGQLYFRAQIALCDAFLPTSGTAVFLYAKQIATAFSQIIGFLKRVEFPNLVSRLREAAALNAMDIFGLQKVSTASAIVASIAITVASLTYYWMTEGAPSEAALAVAIFGPTILMGALALSYVQTMLAIRQFRPAACVMILATAAGAVAAWVLIRPTGLWGLAMADIVANIITIGLCAHILKRGRPASTDERA